MNELPGLSALTSEQKDALIHLLWGAVLELRQEVASLKAEVAELREQLAKNSRNSSKPPSAEGLRKPKTLRKSGERPPGGQPGHPGKTLERSAQPDHVVVHPLPATACEACGRALSGQICAEVRQVFDLPPLRMEVTEHRIVEARCACGRVHRGAFPAEVAAGVQYGPGVKALAVYLTQHHMLPLERSGQLMADLYGLPIANATILGMIQEAEERLSPTTARIAEAIVCAPVAGADETGLRVAGKLHWLHTAVTEALTWMGVHGRRGQAAFAEFGLLPRFTGILSHDGWAPYRDLSCEHALCNAHHLRELTFVHEVCGQPWAGHMIEWLLSAHQEVRAHKGQALSTQRITTMRARYDALLSEGQLANPPAPRSAKRGRARQSFPFNLLRRLTEHADDVLRFTTNPLAP
jgi:transposase